MQAARSELTDYGIQGFSIRRVAQSAGVARPSLVLRWPDADALIIEALDSFVGLPPLPDSGDLRTDLIELAREQQKMLQSPILNLQTQLTSAARTHPALFQHFQEKVVRRYWWHARSIFEAAVARGELPRSAPLRWLVEAFTGGIYMHTIGTPGIKPPTPDECLALIDVLILGAKGSG